MRLLFVCLGNICRSPTAEGVMRALVARGRADGSVELDSAGTGGWHVGSPPDCARRRRRARARGRAPRRRAAGAPARTSSASICCSRWTSANLDALMRLAGSAEERAKVRLLREFDPASAAADALDVPDPYYGAAGGFEEVFDLVQAACGGLLDGSAPASGRDPPFRGEQRAARRRRRHQRGVPRGARRRQQAFVKTRADATPGEYAAEAAGLRWLAEPGALRTPRVLEVDERYLALEWISAGRLDAAGARGARPGPRR